MNRNAAIIYQDLAAGYAQSALQTLLDLPQQATQVDRELALRWAARWQRAAAKYAKDARFHLGIEQEA